MKSPSSTIHVSIKGTVTVLSASLDAGECLAAYRNCTKPGTVFYSRMGHLDKNKKIIDVEAAEKKAAAEAKKVEAAEKKAAAEAKKAAKPKE